MAALITKYESDFFGKFELNKISTEVLELSVIEMISMGLGAVFAVVVGYRRFDNESTTTRRWRSLEFNSHT